MKINSTAIDGVYVAETSSFEDERGAFARLFCDADLADALGGRRIRQINRSRTVAVGAVRGMHFQLAPHAEMKMVRCLKGRVWDVALDLRCGSPTFMKWHSQELSAANDLMLVIPEGCAHGFQVLEQDSELLYLHTEIYIPSMEGGVRFDDPACAIAWPMQARDLSERDKKHPLMDKNFKGIKL